MSRASKSAVGNLLTQVVSYPIAVAIGILTARTLGADGKGIYVFLVLLIKGILPILMLGFGGGVQYYIGSERFDMRSTAFTTLLVALGWGSLIGVFIYGLWYWGLLGETGDAIPVEAMLITVITLPFTAVYILFSLALKGAFEFKLHNALTIAKNVSLAGFLLGLVYFANQGIVGAAYALLCEAIGTALFLVIVLSRKYRPTLSFNSEYTRLSFVYGTKIWLGSLAQQSNDKLDQIILGVMNSPQLLGIYSVAFSIVRMMNFLPNAIAPVFFNLIARSKDPQREVELTAQMNRSLLLIVGSASLILVVAAPWLIDLFYGPEFVDAYYPMLILIPGMLAFAITRRILSKYLAGKGKPQVVSLIQGVGAILGILLYIVLIPYLDVVGAALGSTAAYIASTVVAVYYFNKTASPHRANLFLATADDLRWIVSKVKSINR